MVVRLLLSLLHSLGIVSVLLLWGFSRFPLPVEAAGPGPGPQRICLDPRRRHGPFVGGMGAICLTRLVGYRMMSVICKNLGTIYVVFGSLVLGLFEKGSQGGAFKDF
ncbi:hypothetical protein TRIUR3_00233 [Triticum urartu]|uniref:Uncharacterized protein n=1 Tax=Triticum urartu TaxID=4572 RepID=M7YMF8_TRIUA|nr:hypothetical protein TRIUR3_00233 [Triticum urartu]